MLLSDGIDQFVTAPYSHQQNGIAERTIRTIMVRARKMLFHFDIPREFWVEAVRHSNHIRNITHCNTINGTPNTVYSGQQPDFSSLRVWGCLAWARIPPEIRGKLDKQSKPLTYLGSDASRGGYRLWDSEQKLCSAEMCDLTSLSQLSALK
jgi:hypothetical protein